MLDWAMGQAFNTKYFDIGFDEDPEARTVLLVEDSNPDIVLIKEALKLVWPGVQVTAVTSIRDAYEIYKKCNFDLILLDLNLPDGMGPNTVKEVRRFNRRVPIVVVTGMGTKLTVREALRLGANDVVLKSDVMRADFKNILEQHVC